MMCKAMFFRKGLAVGAYTIWLSRLFMILTSPLSWPIGKILDFIVGEEVTAYRFACFDHTRILRICLSHKLEEGGPKTEFMVT